MLGSILRTGGGIARLYVDIALWRRGPQEVPAVGILLPLTVAAYVLLSVAAGELVPALRAGWLMRVGTDVLFVAAWYYGLLRLVGRPERYLQTASALFGVQAVLAVPGILALALAQRFAADPAWQLPASAGAIAVWLWTLAAIGHILRSALERPLVMCLILAFLQLLIEELVFLGLFGAG